MITVLLLKAVFGVRVLYVVVDMTFAVDLGVRNDNKTSNERQIS